MPPAPPRDMAVLDAIAKDAIDTEPAPASMPAAAEPEMVLAEPEPTPQSQIEPAPLPEAAPEHMPAHEPAAVPAEMPSLRGLMARSADADAIHQFEPAPAEEMLPPPAAHTFHEPEAPRQHHWRDQPAGEESAMAATADMMDDAPLARYATLTPRPRQRMAGFIAWLAFAVSLVGFAGYLLVASGVRVQAAGVAATTPQFLTYVSYAAMAGGGLGLLGLLWALATGKPGGVKRSLLAVLASTLVLASTVLAPKGGTIQPTPALAPDPDAGRAELVAPPDGAATASAPSGLGKLVCQIERNRARAMAAGETDLSRFGMQTARAEAELAARADRTGIDSDPDYLASVGASFLGEPEVRIEPAYPSEALAREMEGVVLIALGFGRSGTVARAYVLAADPPDVFNAAAMDAVWAWTNRTHGDATNAPLQFVDVTIRFCLEQGNAEQAPVTN